MTWRDKLAALALAALVALGLAYRHSLIERGKALAALAHADSVLATNQAALGRVDTVLVERLRTVPRVVARVDTLRDTVLAHLTDTVLVREYVARADTALKACSELLGDCAAFRRLAQERFAAYEMKLAAQPKAEPRSCTASNVVWTGVGAIAGAFLRRPP